MYVQDHFRMPEADLARFLERQGMGTLVSVDPLTAQPAASLLPWALVGGDTLTSHIGLRNDQLAHTGQALVIFEGARAYVSEEWMGEGAAPTLDYEVVHVYGDLTIHDEPDWIIGSFRDLMARFSRKDFDEYDEDWLQRQARACRGVELKISQIQAKSKLSQNRSAAEAESIASQLEASCPALSARIREVSLPHIAARQERVDQARPYGSA